MKRIDGIVLAGTHHWGRSLFESLSPRPLLPVGQKPLITYVLQWLKDGGIDNTIVCANSSTRAVQARLRHEDRLAPGLRYYEDDSPRGAAGCARDAAISSEADAFIIANATVIPRLDVRHLLAEHHRTGADVTVVVERAANDAPDHQSAPAGIYVFNRDVLQSVPALGFHDIKESLIPRLYCSGKSVVTYQAAVQSPQVLDAASYLAANHWVAVRAVSGDLDLPGFVPSETRGDYLTHRTARIDPSAIVVGPVLIGPGVQVMRDAAVIGPACIEAGTVIGAGAVVSRSVVWANSTVGERSFLDASLVGARVSVPPDSVVTSRVFTEPHPSDSFKAPSAFRPGMFVRRLASAANFFQF